jgi:predicted neuraminidase
MTFGPAISPAHLLVIIQSEFIYQSAPFPSCHASTICETTRGEYLVAWFGGTAESNPDVAIYTSKWRGKSWSPPILTAQGFDDNDRRLACYNPVLFQPSNGPLLLFYKVGKGPQTWWGMMMMSNDRGETWSSPTKLPKGIYGPIKNKPFELKDHTLLCPSSTEDHGWQVHFEFTSDFGKSWTRTEAINDPSVIGAIQPSIIVLKDKTLRSVGRTQQGFVFFTDSKDHGRTWSPMALTNAKNPNSGLDAITLRDGRHLMIDNDTLTGRSPLNVFISDDGTTWNNVLTLEKDPGEYTYPSLIQAKDGTVHVVYTWRRQRIKHVVLKVS